MRENNINLGPMLNAYPDSVGGTLSDIITVLKKTDVNGAFSSFYILPSIFNTDLDRGFSVIDYRLNDLLAKESDIASLNDLGIDLKLDFILNHASVLSPQFQDILKKGDESEYRDFFIDWNKFWEGHGTMTDEGYIQPEPELIKDMFFRKAGLPILMVRFPDGRDVPYWNTFYQELRYSTVDPQDLLPITDGKFGAAQKLAAIVNAALDEGKRPSEIDFGELGSFGDSVVSYLEGHRRYLGQMDLNIRSPLVWKFYKDTLAALASYGAKIVRLDAFAYAPKDVGARNFLNTPDTWDLLQKVTDIASPYGITLLPEIHASYEEGTYRTIAEKGYMVYDFFLPGLILDAFEEKNGEVIAKWAQEIIDSDMLTVNMLGCHDGIPLLDLKGLLPEERIQNIIDTVVRRGGYVKDLHGAKNVYYQVNATYYSALGEDDRRMLLARAIQLFMPGKPQVWYLDLFAGKNDYEAMRLAGVGGHKEINRTNLSLSDISEGLKKPIVQDQLRLLRMRNSYKAFNYNAEKRASSNGHSLLLSWAYDGEKAILEADLASGSFSIRIYDESKDIEIFKFEF